MSSELRVLSLGAGVQSTALALLSHARTIPDRVPLFDAAIFADTGEEPEEVYHHLSWLTEHVAPSFPILVRSAGRLGDDLVSGARHAMNDGTRFASIPAFTKDETSGGPGGMTKRQCTSEYKTAVVDRTIKRDLLGLAPRQRVPAGTVVHQYIGLSFDEGRRIFGNGGSKPGTKARIEANSWARAHFPLYDAFLTREAIRGWLDRYGVPHRVPRSACLFCPFHSDGEWQRLKAEDPKGWARIVEIDKALRNDSVAARDLRGNLYLHRSCQPIEDVEFRPGRESKSQDEINFSELECEGVCGL